MHEQVEVIASIAIVCGPPRRKGDDVPASVNGGGPAWLHPAGLGILAEPRDDSARTIEHEHVKKQIDVESPGEQRLEQTRLEASDSKATYRPFAEIAGRLLAPFAVSPDALRLTSDVFDV